MKSNNAIGILGGMGPDASNYMYKMLIDISVKQFNAKNNDDFPEIILYSIPVSDFISSTADKNVALEMLRDRVRYFNKLNVSCLSIACNTAHLLLDDLQKISNAPFVSMIDEVAETVKTDNLKKVGILGSPMTIKSKLYKNSLKKFKIESVTPNKKQQQILDKIIRNVIKGESGSKDIEQLLKIADGLAVRGAEIIVLGCTELPIIFPLQYKIPVYNSVKILSMALLRRYYESNTINTI